MVKRYLKRAWYVFLLLVALAVGHPPSAIAGKTGIGLFEQVFCSAEFGLVIEIHSNKVLHKKGREKIFLIKGAIQNGGRQAVTLVRIRASVGSVERGIFKFATAYAGNTLSEEEILSLDKRVVNRRLNNPLGDNGANLCLMPGRRVEFMVVFYDLPDPAVEFSVDIFSAYPLGSVRIARAPSHGQPSANRVVRPARRVKPRDPIDCFAGFCYMRRGLAIVVNFRLLKQRLV